MFSTTKKRSVLAALILFIFVLPTRFAAADFVQQGPKLVGTGTTVSSFQGSAVSVSADGNTAIVGGPYDDDGFIGGAWIFVRSNGVWTQQGGRLIGTGFSGTDVYQGSSVALSADGNTAIIGGPYDSLQIGAAWVFVRNNGVWTQQGGKLVGTGSVFNVFQGDGVSQGSSVALSADGNTALVGGTDDAYGIGAVWVFTRNGNVWTQQGNKLVGTGSVGAHVAQGAAAALSPDGNTALVGGSYDNGNAGATWVFTRTGGVWSQLGSKLVGTGATAMARQGQAVSLSADGKTAAIGGYRDANDVGATWVFTFNGTAWTQQGSKLVGSGRIGTSSQGWGVSLSTDGDTLLVGGSGDAGATGAAWIFGRSGGTWSQRGNKLVGTGATGAAGQGISAALSADGSTAIVGGYSDNNVVGASWMWLRRTPHDFDGGGKSDIFWRNAGGANAIWSMNGSSVASVALIGGLATNWTAVGQRDFDGDGKVDILWRDTSGNVAIWFMNGSKVLSTVSLGNIGANWNVAGTADLNGDGRGDIIWRNGDGAVAVWLMNGPKVSSVALIGVVATSWSIVGTADFDGDGKGDILWRNTAGTNAIWLMNGAAVSSVAVIGGVGTNWSVAGTADFDGDGRGDILWREAGGSNAIWFMNGTSIASVSPTGGVGANWSVASTGDYNGDGKGDILWREAGGSNAIWFMNGAAVSSVSLIGGVATNWSVQNAGAN